MGIRGLGPYAAKAAASPSDLHTLRQQHFAGARPPVAAIDAELWLYRACYKWKPGAHLAYFAEAVTAFVSAGFVPMVVFDGGSVLPKTRALEIRQRARVRLQERADAGDAHAKEQLIDIPPSHRDELKTLLRCMGVTVVEVPDEAERVCAMLYHSRVCDVVVSDDTDTLVYDALVLKTGHSVVRPQQIVELLGLEDHAQFVLWAVLSGTDYLTTLPKIGPATALKAIKFHKTLEDIVQFYRHRLPPNTDTEWLPQAHRVMAHFTARETFDVERPSVAALSTDFDGLVSVLQRFRVKDAMRIARLFTNAVEQQKRLAT